MNKVQRRILNAIVERPPVRRNGLSITALSVSTELSEKAVRTNLHKLKAAGLIDFSRPRPGKPYDFHIHDKTHEELRHHADISKFAPVGRTARAAR